MSDLLNDFIWRQINTDVTACDSPATTKHGFMTSGLDIRLLTSLFPPQRHAPLVCHPGWVRTGTPGGWTWKGHTATGQLLVQLWKAKVKSRTEASTRHQFTGRSQTQVSAFFFFSHFRGRCRVGSDVLRLLLCWKWNGTKGIRTQWKKPHLSKAFATLFVLCGALFCSSWLPAFDLLRQYPGATPRKL